jgi:hypothetical protein
MAIAVRVYGFYIQLASRPRCSLVTLQVGLLLVLAFLIKLRKLLAFPVILIQSGGYAGALRTKIKFSRRNLALQIHTTFI